MRLAEIGVHVAGHGCHARHPVKPHVIYEIIHRLLLLPMSHPEHVPGLESHDVRSVAVAVIQLELVYSQVTGLPSGLSQLGAVVGRNS